MADKTERMRPSGSSAVDNINTSMNSKLQLNQIEYHDKRTFDRNFGDKNIRVTGTDDPIELLEPMISYEGSRDIEDVPEYEYDLYAEEEELNDHHAAGYPSSNGKDFFVQDIALNEESRSPIHDTNTPHVEESSSRNDAIDNVKRTGENLNTKEANRERSGSRKRKTPTTTGKKKNESKVKTIRPPIDVNQDTLIRLVRQNPNIIKVLHALYVHRRLTAAQIHRLFFREKHISVVKTTIQRWIRYRVFEREYIFLLAKVKSEPAIHYSLSSFGARLYAEACMDIVLLDEALASVENSPQQHYHYEDLAIVKQDVHHYILQSFLSEFIGAFWVRKEYLPSAEAKRYYYFKNNQERGTVDEVIYKPDWIIFKPNSFFANLVESSKIGHDILNVPVTARNSRDQTILNEHYVPLLSIEADTGTMSSSLLIDKFDRMRTMLPYIPKCVTFAVGEGPYGKQRIELVESKPKENKRRLFTIAEAAEKAIRDILLDDELTILVGRERNLVPTCLSFIEHNENLQSQFNLPDTWWNDWFPSYTSMTERELTKLSITSGKPDLTLRESSTGHMVSIFWAMPCWVNPQIRVNQLENVHDMKRLMVYPTFSDIEKDAQIVRGEVLYMTLEDILQEKKIIYEKDHDRSGVYWRPVVQWPF